MTNTLHAEDPICPSCKQDDVECLEDCTLHRCVHCGYSELEVLDETNDDGILLVQ